MYRIGIRDLPPKLHALVWGVIGVRAWLEGEGSAWVLQLELHEPGACGLDPQAQLLVVKGFRLLYVWHVQYDKVQSFQHCLIHSFQFAAYRLPTFPFCAVA